MASGIIYLATNSINGKKYVGQSVSSLGKVICRHEEIVGGKEGSECRITS